jgi:hypothetical protein
MSDMQECVVNSVKKTLDVEKPLVGNLHISQPGILRPQVNLLPICAAFMNLSITTTT